MSVYYVFQGETYDHEREGEYVWSPQLAKGGRKNAGYTMMRNIKVGDFILHNKNGKIVAISIAQTDCYESNQPKELMEALTTAEWDDEGFRVDTKYYEFETPVAATDYKEWLVENYIKDSAFTVSGTGKQQYMCALAYEHAVFLIEEVIRKQNEEDVLTHLNNALFDIVGDKSSEYNSLEIELINEAISSNNLEGEIKEIEWAGVREKQSITTSSKTGRVIPKRDPQRAVDALKRASYLCEFNNLDRTFTRKNGKAYTEPHHLIPISKYYDFEYSVDVMENIISLCSHCHNLLHYGKLEDKMEVLEKLFDERKDALKNVGIEITFEQLLSYYK